MSNWLRYIVMGLLTLTLSISLMAQEQAVPLKNENTAAAAPAETPEEQSAEEQALKLEIEARLSQFSDDFLQLQLVGSMALTPDAKLGINKNFVSVLEGRMNTYNQRYNSLDVMWTTYTQAQQMDIANDDDLMTMVANIEALKQSVKDTLDAKAEMVKAISDFAAADQFICRAGALATTPYESARRTVRGDEECVGEGTGVGVQTTLPACEGLYYGFGCRVNHSSVLQYDDCQIQGL